MINQEKDLQIGMQQALEARVPVMFAYIRKDGKWRPVNGVVKSVSDDHVIVFDFYRDAIRRFNFKQFSSGFSVL